MEQLESLEEELQEMGFGTLGEVEAALSPAGTAQDEKLIDIRDQMIDLNVINLREIRDHISRVNEELDERDELQN